MAIFCYSKIMKILYISLGLIVLYFAVEVGLSEYKYLHYPKLPDIDQSDKTFGQGPVLRYIAAGDSIGVGEGASELSQTFNYKVAEVLAQTHTVEYKNISVRGYTTSDVLNKQVDDIIAYKPDIVTISMSGNDATHLVSGKKVLENYKTIIGKLEQGTGAKIYISNVPNFNGASALPWFFIDFIEWRSEAQDKTMQLLEDDRTKIVNIHNFGWDKDPYKDRSKTYAADHFHPNDLGYQNWTDAFLAKIK